ncbi:MAG: hypothetical protein C5B49_10220 [Bdellovibrio sp.]|nr:MAG: hypothetical protein C5B49_10220 [Bdellovibrio sp.]
MEFEREITAKIPDFAMAKVEGDSELRIKTSLRMKYEAEAAVIEKNLGNLDQIRQDLGLSARKICQLLMVDPSAWSRWTRPGGKAPPHIWRALQWYLSLQEKVPGLHANYFLNRPAIRVDTKTLQQVQELEFDHRELLGRMQSLEKKSDSLIQRLQEAQRVNKVYEVAGLVVGLMLAGFVAFLWIRGRG